MERILVLGSKIFAGALMKWVVGILPIIVIMLVKDTRHVSEINLLGVGITFVNI